MYVSVTGLKPKSVFGAFRFWVLAIPSFRAAQKADGCLFCETKTRNGFHHTLTVWTDKKAMMKYRASPTHLRAMKAFSKIATGKVYGYDADTIPSWNAALDEYDLHARSV